ncbi:TRAP transporter permease [Nitratireductor sp. GCM10026969]|uniref:TRAP transporter permease n=1 Tax=Nitratireductor sp. GCM10026969 TaxID=3252645 RepID=UPI003616E07F
MSGTGSGKIEIAEQSGARDYEGYGALRKIVVSALSLSLFLYPFVTGMLSHPPALVFRPTYLALMLILCALVLPPKICARNTPGAYLLDGILVLGAAAAIWIAFVWLDFVLVFTLTLPQKLLCILLLLGAMELTRRTPVKPLNYIAIGAIAYALFGYMLPALFGHAGLSVDRLLWSQIFTTDGLFGTPLAIGATYIGLFVFFAAFLEASGGGQKFMSFTMALAGRFSGGPAKVAILASALMGMMSGSAVTNIVTTGVITIPMMKRVGYRPEVAAGVESTASLGSQITPPILGATAFLMSEITGVPLIQIMGLALIPCLLFYLCIFMQVHLASVKLGMKGMDPREIPDLRRSSIEVVPFILPLVVLVYLLWRRYSPDYAISSSIIAFFAVCMLQRQTRQALIGNFMNGIRQGARTCIPLVGSLAIAGVIIGILTMTGLGDRLSYLIEIVSGGNIHIMILVTALTCMFLGMGMVTIGAYVLVAVTTAPLMVDLGIPLVVAHLFIFYFAVMSAISPPVMVGVFAAASIADSDPIKTALHSLRFSIVGFLVPFIFIYEPRILMLGGFTPMGAFLLFTTVIGIIALSMGFERYSLFNRLPHWKAALFVAVAVIVMMPMPILSIAGTAIFALLMLMEMLHRRLARSSAA